MLGGVLLEQKRYTEAEPLLLVGYEGMGQRYERLPAGNKPQLKETAKKLARLYEATNQPDKAAEWRKKADEPADFGRDQSKSVPPR